MLVGSDGRRGHRIDADFVDAHVRLEGFQWATLESRPHTLAAVPCSNRVNSSMNMVCELPPSWYQPSLAVSTQVCRIALIGGSDQWSLPAQPVGLLLRGQRLVRHFRQEELGFIAFLVGHHEAGGLALRLEGVAHLGHLGPGGRRLVGIEPGVLVELLVVVDDVALQGRRDEVELAVRTGEGRLADHLGDQVGQLVVERDQAADRFLACAPPLAQITSGPVFEARAVPSSV